MLLSLAASLFTSVSSSAIASGLARVAIGVGLSFLGKMLSTDSRSQGSGSQPEIRLEGEKTPRQIAFGRFYTAGFVVTPFYAFDKYSQGIPNDTRVQILALADAPISGIDKVWVDETEFDVDTDLTGSPAITGAGMTPNGSTRPDWAGSNPELYVAWALGDQTVASSWLTSTFGSHPERPWGTDRIGTGIAYAYFGHKANDDVYGSEPSNYVEGRGAPVYDRRLDSTAGGTGAHRAGNASTWEYKDNALTLAMAVITGYPIGPDTVAVGYDWSDLDYAEWTAEQDECDVLVDGVAQYRAGYLANIKTQDRSGETAIDIARHMLKAANAEVADVAGQLHVRIGGPDLPLVTITDDDIVISSPREYEPVRSRTDRHNAVRVSHRDPSQRWAMRESPLRTNDAAVTRDGELRVAPVTLEAVLDDAQAQRIAQSLVDDDQRQRAHVITLDASFDYLHPLTSLAWTSAHNGYDAKVFEVERMAIDPGTQAVTLAIRERDPDDYDPDITIVAPATPSAQVVSYAAFPLPGFAVQAVTLTNADATSSKPGIRISWTADLAGVKTVEFEVRRQGQTDLVANGSIAAENGIKEVSEGLLASTVYEARARGLDQKTEWTSWVAVTTPGALLGASDIDVQTILADVEQAAADAQAAADDARNDLLAIIGDGASAIDPVMSQVDSIVEDLDLKADDVDTTEAIEAANSVLADLALLIEGQSQAFSDIGASIDPETGRYVLWSTEATNEAINDVRIELDGLNASISLSATTAYVDQAISDAVLDPSQIPVIEDIETTLSQVQLDLDAVESSLTGYATVTTVNGIAADVTQAELDIDALEATIVLKVDSTEFDGLESRVTTAETTLSTIDGAQITTLAQDVILLAEDTEADQAATVEALLAAYEATEYTTQAIAYAREDLFALVDDNRVATASLRTELGAQIDNTVALIETEQLVRAQEDAALAALTEALDVRLTDTETDVEAQAQAATLLEGRVETVEGTTTAQGTAITQVQAQVDGLATTVTQQGVVNTAQANAISGLQTDVTANSNAITANASDITDLDVRLTTNEGATAANASAQSALEARVTAAEWSITSQSTSITTLTADLGTVSSGLTTAEGEIDAIQTTNVAQGVAITGLQTTVTSINGTVTSQGVAITQLQSDVTTLDSGKADASALTALVTDVTANEDGITALAGRVDDLRVEVDSSAFVRTFDFSGQTLDGLFLAEAGVASYNTTTDASPTNKDVLAVTLTGGSLFRLTWVEDVATLRGKTVSVFGRWDPNGTGCRIRCQARRKTSVNDATELPVISGAWVDLPDFNFPDALTEADLDIPDDDAVVIALRVEVEAPNGRVVRVTDFGFRDATTDRSIAGIQSVQTVQATEVSALADDLTTVSASLGSLSATVTTQATAIADIEGNQTAALVFSAAAGGAVSSLELVALDNPSAGTVATITFNNDLSIFGGDLASVNYVADTSGWMIDRDGNAEFNSIKVRTNREYTLPNVGATNITSSNASSPTYTHSEIEVDFIPNADNGGPIEVVVTGEVSSSDAEIADPLELYPVIGHRSTFGSGAYSTFSGIQYYSMIQYDFYHSFIVIMIISPNNTINADKGWRLGFAVGKHSTNTGTLATVSNVRASFKQRNNET